MKILQVKRFHKEIADKNYQEAVDKSKARGYGFPVRSWHYFIIEDRKGYPVKLRKNGYVAFENKKYCFGLSIEKAIKVFNS